MSLRSILAFVIGRAQPAIAEPAPQPPVQPRIRRAISEETLARARAKKTAVNPFEVKSELHPPQASSGLAMDELLSDYGGWAAAAVSGMFAEGQAFLGYPMLAEMAQRAEYRRPSEIIARAMTRKWIEFQATGDEDKSDKIAKLETAMKRLGVRAAFKKAAEQDGFFGRAHIYIDTGDTDDRDELATSIGTGDDEASAAKISKGKIKKFRPVEAVWCYPTAYNSNDPLKPDWYKPASWFVMGKQLHASRLLTFVAREVPDLLKPAYSFGGLSLSQMGKPYVDNWLRTRQSVADIVSSFSTFVLMTKMADSMQTEGEEMFRRAELFNSMRDNAGLLMIDKLNEDFKNVSAPLGTIDMLQAQTQEHQSSVFGIPLSILLGITPQGLNASSEGEIRTFEDMIHALQEDIYRPNLTTAINLVQLSVFGEIDPEITFEFVPLHSLDEKEKSEQLRRDAETDQIYMDGGVVRPEEVRQRLANDKNSIYPGLDPDDVPELPAPGEEDEPPAPGLKEAA